MSDEPQGSGWWQASDLKWYPPEQHPNDVAPLPPPAKAPPTPPSSGQSQRRIALIAVIAAVAVTLMVGAGVAGYFLHQPSGTTTAPPVAEAALDGLLLSPDQINTAMSATGMTVSKAATALVDDSGVISDKACLPVNDAAEAAAYAGSGYSAVRVQTLQGQIPVADQAVVLFSSGHDAGAFFTAAAQRWSACSNRQYTENSTPPLVITVGPVSNASGTLNVTETVAVNGTPLMQERALTVANNVVIDVAAGGLSRPGAAVNIARQIAAKVPTH
jgi:hypothetical protein